MPVATASSPAWAEQPARSRDPHPFLPAISCDKPGLLNPTVRQIAVWVLPYPLAPDYETPRPPTNSVWSATDASVSWTHTPNYRAVLLRRMVGEVLASRWLQRTCSCGGRKQGAYRLGKCSYGEATCTSPACFILPYRSLWSVLSKRAFGWRPTKASFSGHPQCPNTAPAEDYVEIIARCAV